MGDSSYNDIKKIIMDSLMELGFCIGETEEDININEYGIDSFTYISFIVILSHKSCLPNILSLEHVPPKQSVLNSQQSHLFSSLYATPFHISLISSSYTIPLSVTFPILLIASGGNIW